MFVSSAYNQNRSFQNNVPSFLRKRPILILIAVAIVIFYALFLNTSKSQLESASRDTVVPESSDNPLSMDLGKVDGAANPMYYYQNNYWKYNSKSSSYRIAIVADRDKRSKNADQGHWESKLRKGTLTRNTVTNKYSVSWDSGDTVLTSKLSEDGRAMELSELVFYNHKLLTVDDRTGLVLSIENGKAVPQHILMDGNGQTNKGFKSEWATVKDGLLYVGSTGKEWTNKDGVVVNNNPQWIKTIDTDGTIQHVDWTTPYESMRATVGAQYPGYILHEAAAWNPMLRQWFFLPRRFSTEEYDDVADEERGTNMIITATEDFHDIKFYRIGELIKTRGFSSIKFIPGRETEVVAIKSEEFRDRIASYITVFDIVNGDILMDDVEIEEEKYEGVEIL